MSFYTCIVIHRDHIDLNQAEADSPEIALSEWIGSLPYDDGEELFDEEREWLQNVANGLEQRTLHPLDHCKNTWLWREGTRYQPQYRMYVIQTDVNADN